MKLRLSLREHLGGVMQIFPVNEVDMWGRVRTSHFRHEELLAKGGLYSDMWLKQQQAQDSDSASDTETKDRKSEKLQPQTSTAGHKEH